MRDLWTGVDLLEGNVLVKFIERQQLIGSFRFTGSLRNRKRTQLWYIYIYIYMYIWFRTSSSRCVLIRSFAILPWCNAYLEPLTMQRAQDLFSIVINGNLCKLWIPHHAAGEADESMCSSKKKQKRQDKHLWSVLRENKQWMNAIADEGKPVIDVKRWINMGVDPERPQGVICLNPREKKI